MNDVKLAPLYRATVRLNGGPLGVDIARAPNPGVYGEEVPFDPFDYLRHLELPEKHMIPAGGVYGAVEELFTGDEVLALQGWVERYNDDGEDVLEATPVDPTEWDKEQTRQFGNYIGVVNLGDHRVFFPETVWIDAPMRLIGRTTHPAEDYGTLLWDDVNELPFPPVPLEEQVEGTGYYVPYIVNPATGQLIIVGQDENGEVVVR